MGCWSRRPGALRGRYLGGAALERRDPRAHVVAAAAVRQILQEAPVRLHCGVTAPAELLRAGQIEQDAFVEEVLGPQPRQGRFVGGLGLGEVLLGLPRVPDADGGQRADRALRALGQRDLIGAARRGVLAGRVAEIAEAIGGLGTPV